MSNNNGQKPIAEDQKYPQLIFKAEVIEKDGKKDIAFIYKSQHIPTLDCIVQQMNYDIIKFRAMEEAKREKAKLGLLVKGPIQSLESFLKRKRR